MEDFMSETMRERERERKIAHSYENSNKTLEEASVN
jgi:hypothetical protein